MGQEVARAALEVESVLERRAADAAAADCSGSQECSDAEQAVGSISAESGRPEGEAEVRQPALADYYEVTMLTLGEQCVAH